MDHSTCAALEKQRLEELAARPNTQVLQVTHDFVKEPWPAERIVRVTNKIIETSLASNIKEDFDLRKELLKNTDIKKFQYDHPRLFWTLSDRKLMKEPKYRRAVQAMLNVHAMVETGVVEKGDVSNAVATQAVMHALNEGASAGPAPNTSSIEELD